MSASIRPEFAGELEKYGAKGVSACFNCGNCTAVCGLSTSGAPFPRKLIRAVQLGLTDRIAESPEPWLCYYCGECSDTCPRQADPGETMMALRRYLTARYDATGISRLFYTSKAFEIGSLLFVAFLVGLCFHLFHGPVIAYRMALNVFAPVKVMEILDLVLLVLLSTVLLLNASRMFRLVMGDPGQYPKLSLAARQEAGNITIRGVPVRYFLEEAKEFFVHFATQRNFASCGTKSAKMAWYEHLLVMSGYSTVFLLVVVGLRWFQTDTMQPIWNPVRLLGYYATFGILYGVTRAIKGRLAKDRAARAHSHSSDWVFLVMLWLTAFTGILVHAARLADWPLGVYALYVVHLMVAVPMLAVEVPFAKWAHQLYRPLVLYLMKVKARALAGE